MKVAVVVDDYKVATFKKILRNAGYSWEQGSGVCLDTSTLYIETDNPEALHAVVKNCEFTVRKRKYKWKGGK